MTADTPDLIERMAEALLDGGTPKAGRIIDPSYVQFLEIPAAKAAARVMLEAMRKFKVKGYGLDQVRWKENLVAFAKENKLDD